MNKRSKIVLWLISFGLILFVSFAQAKIPKQPFKEWHDRIFLGQLEMEKNVYMEATLFLQGALINKTTGGDPVIVGDHLRVDGILFANNIIVRGESGGEPVIIGDHLRVDGDIFNPFNAVRIKDDLKIKGALSGWSNLKISSAIDVQQYLYSSKNSLEIKDGLVQSGEEQVIFSGNVDANKGLDITGGDLTVGGSTKFRVSYGTGNISTDGSLAVAGPASLSTLSSSGLASLDSLSVTRSSNFGNAVNIQGNATFYKNVTLGDTAGDVIAIGGTASFSNPISGNLSTTGNLNVGANLNVAGTSVCGTISFTNLTVSGDTTLQGAVQLGDAAADGIPVLGTATFAQDTTFAKTIAVQSATGTSTFQNNVAIGGNLDVGGTLTAAAVNVAGTTYNSFAINTDNASADAEDMQLIFHRGTVAPHAIISWDSTNDEFNLNQKINIQNTFYVDSLGNAGGYAGKEAALVGDLKVTGNIDPVDISYTGSLSGNLAHFSGATSIGGNLTVTGATSLQTLSAGATTLTGALNTGANNITSTGTITGGTVNATTLQQGGVAIDTLYVNVAGDTMTGGLDMSNQVISNIGAAGTDFTGTGGLTLASTLTVSAGGASISGGLNNNAGGITNAGAISGATAITASGTIQGGTLTDGTFTVTGGTVSAGTWQGTAIADAYVADNLTISGGTINNSVIGGVTPAAGSFTSLAGNTLAIGGGTAITQHLSATSAQNLAAPTAVPGCVETAAITVTGASLGDTVVASMSIALPTDYTIVGYVSAANSVIVRLCQLAGTASDPDGAGATYRVDLWKH